VPDEEEAAAEEEADEDFIEDYQLSRAIDLLRGLHLFRATLTNKDG